MQVSVLGEKKNGGKDQNCLITLCIEYVQSGRSWEDRNF